MACVISATNSSDHFSISLELFLIELGRINRSWYALNMSKIQIKTETEQPNRWCYEVSLKDKGQTYDYDVTLSWADYDLWSHGRVAPEKVIVATFEFLLEREPAAAILTKFDCSLIRRYFPEVDQKLPKMI